MSKFSGLTKGKEKAEEKAAKTKGRRQDPDYLQTTVYLPKDLHKAVKVAMAEDNLELSGIVETLLAEWLKSRKS